MDSQNYYKLPLNLGDISAKKELEKCSLRDSIAHHLHLILTTSFDELSSDEAYGNKLWEEDFDNVSFRNKQKEKILESVTKTINKYERRIEKVKVEMNVQQEESKSRNLEPAMKRKLEFYITGIVTATNEKITYRDGFFISPLAYN